MIDFGWALSALRLNWCVRRRGWNGKGRTRMVVVSRGSQVRPTFLRTTGRE